MRPVSLIVPFALVLAATSFLAPEAADAQAGGAVAWRVRGVKPCPRADSLFGRLYRSHTVGVRTQYSPGRDSTEVRTRLRTGSWETSSSSRLVGTEAGILVPGQRGLIDSVRIEFSLRFVDSLFRAPEQVALVLLVDDSARMEGCEPRVDYAMAPNVRGVPLVVTVLLTPTLSLALARAHEVKGTMGPFPFMLYGWEVWDINAVYRAGICGID
ncbi:MAG: hypothetical protein FIA95_15125 [Gemmatimonadetes bacterium]|nr:hypothetical protein [Gemmatimonadota bacterium]